MPGFSSYSDLVTQIVTNGYEDIAFFEKTLSAGTAGVWTSQWKAAGLPSAGVDPATTPGTVYTSPFLGALGIPATPTNTTQFTSVSTKQRYATSVSIASAAAIATPVTIMVADRLVGVSGLALTSIASVTVNSSALGRYTSGLGVQAYLEITTATTTTAPVVNLGSYTGNVNGATQVGGSVTFPAAATAIASMIGPLPLAAGDTGLTAVASLNVATAGATGICNLVLLRPLFYINLPSIGWAERDLVLQSAALPQIFDGAVLMIATMNSSAVAISGQLRTAYE